MVSAMEKSSHEELTVLERQKLRKSTEEIKAGASDILFCVSQLNLVEAILDKRSRELEFKEKELQSLGSDIDNKVKDFEKDKSEAGNLKKLVEECSQELRSKKNELTAKLDYSTKIQREIELRKKQLGHFTAQLQKLCSEAGKVQDQKKVMEEETDRKKEELSLILDQIKESKNQIRVCGEQIDSKSKELGDIQKLIEQQTSEFGIMKNQCDSMELLIQEKSQELVAREKRHKEILEAICRSSSEMEEKAKEVKAAETEVSDLNTRSERFRLEVEGKEREVDLLRNEIESEEKKLIQVKREMEEETNRKKKDLVLILSKIEESGQKLAALDERVESQQTLLEIRSSELQSLNNQIRVCGEAIDSKSKELGEIQKLTEQQTREFGVMKNQCDSMELLIQEKSQELVAREKRHKEILESICRSSSEMEEKAKEIEAAETEVSDLNVKSERFRQEVEGKEKELDLLRNQIESEEKKLIQLKREMEEETNRKKEDMVLILSRIEESGQKLAALDEQVESQRRLLEIRSFELVSKEMELESAGESSKRFRADIELKEKKLQSLNNLITVCGQEIDSKSKESGEIQKLIEQKLTELGDMKIRCDSIELLIQERSQDLVATEMRHKETLEERAKEVKAAATEARDLNVKSKRFRQEVKGKEKELNLLKHQIDSEEKKRIQRKGEMEEITDRKKKELSLILDQTKVSSQQLAALDEQVESLRRLVERLSMELECVAESSKRFIFDLEVKEKRFQALNSLITISNEQLDLKSKELVEIQRDVELQKQLREMIAALVEREKQPAAAVPIAETEDALMHYGIAASLTRHEVSSILRAMTDPADYVLELVQDDICERTGLHDSFLEVLVLLFEELAKIQRLESLDKSQLQLKAEEVASQWKEKITIEAPKSSLEALAFLLFIVAYKLQKVITKEETALLASFIAQYEQAPTICNSLGLKLEMIPEIVLVLIDKQRYISAVRLICVFELKKDFSPSLLLKEEIISLRRSALERRSSQAKEEDGTRLRAILELVADYKLKIKLPGDLIAKLMVQRENSGPLVRCSV